VARRWLPKAGASAIHAAKYCESTGNSNRPSCLLPSQEPRPLRWGFSLRLRSKGKGPFWIAKFLSNAGNKSRLRPVSLLKAQKPPLAYRCGRLKGDWQ
jgi:hypothetical protein